MNPILVIALAVAPLGMLAYFARVFPRRTLVLVALVPGLLAVQLLTRPELFWLLMVLDAVFLAAVTIDLVTLPSPKGFAVERQTVRIGSLRKPQRVTLTVSNLGRRERLAWIRDSLPLSAVHNIPGDFSVEPGEFNVRLAPRNRSTVHYELTPRRRGAFHLPTVYLRVRSRWGLWQRIFEYACETELNIYPDMQQLGEYAVLARTNRLSLLGVRRTRKIGQDNEFERLRDYTLDDNYKHIDWRSTARRGKLTVKDFQANQSQRIIFLVDCGRMMTNTAAGLSLLDHGLNAMLMLSYVALRQGDSVGLLCFSDEVHGFVPPRGGMQQMNHLLHASFDRFPRLVESRYDQAFLYLASHCRKRSLVVLITNVIDEVNALQVDQYLSSLVGRHLPLGVMLRDHQLFDAADGPTDTDRQFYRAAAAAEILTWRRQVLSDLQAHGVLALDVFPEQMTAPLVNRYLEVKARHLL